MAIICDFCSDPNPEWAFPAKDFEMQGGPHAGGFQGGWTACEPCKRLIDRNDYKGLAKRSAEKFVDRPAGLSIDHLIPSMRKLHERFRQNRTGPPRRLTKADKASGQDPTAKSKGASVDTSRVDFGENVPFAKGDPVVRHAQRGSETFYMDEGFTSEQLNDPRVLNRILSATQPGQGISSGALAEGLTKPLLIRPYWEGARTYHKVVAAVVGEQPRAEDRWTPTPPMMNSRQIIEPLAAAHPLIIEPDQMNAIDDTDWSLSEAHDYARIAHLPFEPIYLDFGGHHNGGLEIQCSLGEANLFGALVWRDKDMWKGGPTIAIAPFGGWKYLCQIIPGHIKKKYNMSDDAILHMSGGSYFYESKMSGKDTKGKPLGSRHFEQWQYQPPGLMFFGPTFSSELNVQMWGTHTMPYANASGRADVERVFAFPEAFGLIQEERIQKDPHQLGMLAITGLREVGQRISRPEKDSVGDPEGHFMEVTPEVNAFRETLMLDSELIGKMCERALLALYFIENAPVEITPVPLSRQVKRQMMREGKEHVASIVVIRPSSGGKRNKDAEASERDYKYRWERRGYFMHIHSNNRHYQNRPDLVKPCHRCEREYAKGTEGVESPDCIKKWIEPVVCGPEHLPLRQKVRVKRKGPS